MTERKKAETVFENQPGAMPYSKEVYQKRDTKEWADFQRSLSRMGQKELVTRNEDLQRLLRENGVAYNIYNDPSGQNRPWELDLVPKIIDAGEWNTIEAGLKQRATLFDLILKDIYGSQQLLRKGFIPPELIFQHPGFLRSCVNMPLPGAKHLTLYAADMTRGQDGRLWVISDRAQAPSGSGYALENRHAMSTVLPEFFQSLPVKRLSPYFDALQQALMLLGPASGNQPRIVILTPGPDNETYFEHSYLAAYLGLTLVQGSDLIVKDNFVWLKTIDGLEKIDVILRRLDDAYCDPLELKASSLLGVPGLMQVVRKGHVAIANPLGSSIIENAGLIPFLPGLARHLLNEDLVIPNIATWWCGQPKEMRYVLENLPKLVIRRIFRNEAGTRSATDGSSLSVKELANLKCMILANPTLYTGQERIRFSTNPSWVNNTLEDRHTLFRSFLVSKNDSYFVMPGGLTRTSNSEQSFVISNQLGGISKDTWVLSEDEEDEMPATGQSSAEFVFHPPHLRSLPSHTAENLFWVGRYTERVIYNARLQRTIMHRLLQSNKSLPLSKTSTEWLLLEILTKSTFTYPGFAPLKPEEENPELQENPWQELTDVLFNEQRPGSLGNNIAQLIQAVYSVRNFWAVDTWRVLRQMEEDWGKAKKIPSEDYLQMISSIDALNTSMFAFLGMNRESVRREQGWNILDLGRKLEQSMYSTHLIRHTFLKTERPQTARDLMETLMVASQSLITYRYTYRDHLQLPLILELMLHDRNYPKSLAYLVRRIKRYIGNLPRASKEGPLTELERLILEIDGSLRTVSGVALAEANPDSQTYLVLHNFLGQLSDLLVRTAQLISKTYFSHSKAQKQLFTTHPSA